MQSPLAKLLKSVVGTSAHSKQLQGLSDAVTQYRKQVNKYNKTKKKADKPKGRSDKERTDDAVKLARLFLRFLRDAIKKSTFKHEKKSIFTKALQNSNQTSNRPLLFTGKLWEVGRKVDEVVNNYVRITRKRNGTVEVYFVNSWYVEPGYDTVKYGYIAHKKLRVHSLLGLLEGKEKFVYDPNNKNHMKIAKFIWICMKKFDASEQKNFFVKAGIKHKYVESSKSYRPIFKSSGKNKDKNKDKKIYPFGKKRNVKGYHPPRPFWNEAVKTFTASLNRRKNVSISSSGKYKLIITVTT